MKPDFSEYDFSHYLEQLSIKHKIVFAAACVERVIPVYPLACHALHMSGNPLLLRERLDQVWEYVLGNDLSQDKIYEYIVDLDRVNDTLLETRLTHLRQWTERAISVLRQLLKLCLRGKTEYIYKIRSELGTLVYNIAFDLVSPARITNSEIFKQVGESTMVKTETERQQQDLLLLMHQEDLSIALVNTIRLTSENIGQKLLEYLPTH